MSTRVYPQLRGLLPACLLAFTSLHAVRDGPGEGFLEDHRSFDPASGIQTLSPWVGRAVLPGSDPVELTVNQNQAEPHLTRSPLDPDVLLATFQEGRYSNGGAQSNGFAVSFDGGFSWERALFPEQTLAGGGSYFRGTDPVVAIDREGRFFHNALVARDNAFDLADIIVQRSDDEGASWTEPVLVYRGTAAVFPDKNWMVVNDQPGTPTSGRLLCTWTNFRTNDFPIMAAYSDDQGSTWSSAQFVSPIPVGTDYQGYQGSLPAYLPGGQLIVLYHHFGNVNATSINGALEMSYSADGGNSFSARGVPVVPNYLTYADPSLRNGGFLPSMAIARETGEVFIAFQGRHTNAFSGSRILFVRSTKTAWNGDTPDFAWSAPTPIDEAVSGVSPIFPTIAVSPDGENVVVSYYTRRQNPQASLLLDHYIAYSNDGGTTWSEAGMGDLRITPETFNANVATATSRGRMIGDYFGLASPTTGDDAFVLCWVDTDAFSAEPRTARVLPLPDDPWTAWQAVHRNAAERALAPASWSSDFDRDGVFDRLEFALGLDPRAQDRPDLEASSIVFGAAQFSLAGGKIVSSMRLSGPAPATAAPVNTAEPTTAIGEGWWHRLELDWQAGDHWQVDVAADRYTLSAPPYAWRVTAQREGGWDYSTWMDWIYPAAYPWVWHYGLGWLYDPGQRSDDRWLYSPDLGWCYTQPALYPFLYVTAAQAWWRYELGSIAPRRFLELSTGAVLER